MADKIVIKQTGASFRVLVNKKPAGSFRTRRAAEQKVAQLRKRRKAK